jgi:hypothetical protein
MQKTFNNRVETIKNVRHDAPTIKRKVYKTDGTIATVARPSVLTAQAPKKRKAQEHARQKLTTNRSLLRSIARKLGF